MFALCGGNVMSKIHVNLSVNYEYVYAAVFKNVLYINDNYNFQKYGETVTILPFSYLNQATL